MKNEKNIILKKEVEKLLDILDEYSSEYSGDILVKMNPKLSQDMKNQSEVVRKLFLKR